MRAPMTLRHEFVESIPDVVQPGTVYVSIVYATAVHKCCCGCGQEVVTPLSPTDWKLVFDGETVSLDPSIGNWSFPCQSHYWITRDRVRWAEKWSKEEIAVGRAHDAAAKKSQFCEKPPSRSPISEPKAAEPPPSPGGLWKKVRSWFGSR